ncbi:MAG: hypothetical protein QOH62_56 [Solirubrobacteraceae bacterium]|jgi:hypothetical protein|nr:hypothetical protein [Solirubrobacteraceae bacterium]
MAVGIIQDFAEGDAAKYDEVVRKMDLNGQMPSGGLFHVAGPGPDGGWRVVDVWESEAAFQAFAEGSIGPLTAEAGMDRPQVRTFEVHNTRDSARPHTDIRFFQVVHLDGMEADAFDSMDAEILGPGVPDAMLFHVNGSDGAGNWIVADAWTSKDARDAFISERVMPVAGRNPAAPRIEDLEVHNTLEARSLV